MKQMKIRVLTMVMALMVMMVSVVSAQDFPDFWHGDKNYPRCYSHMGFHAFVDLTSVWLEEEHISKNGSHVIAVYNILSVEAATDKISTIKTVRVYYDFKNVFIDKNGQWKQLDPNDPIANSAKIVARYKVVI